MRYIVTTELIDAARAVVAAEEVIQSLDLIHIQVGDTKYESASTTREEALAALDEMLVKHRRGTAETVEARFTRLFAAQEAHVALLRKNHVAGHALITDGVMFYDMMRDEDGRSVDQLLDMLELRGEEVYDVESEITVSVYAIAPAVIERCNFVPE